MAAVYKNVIATQRNPRSLRNKLPDVKARLPQYKLPVVALCEYGVDASHHMSGYTLHRSDVFFQSRTALYIRSDLAATFVGYCCQRSLDYFTCKVRLGSLLLTVVSIYLRPAGRVPWVQLEEILDSLETPVLLLGEFNAHHTAWGSRRIDARGRRVLDLMKTRGMCLLNNRTPTYMRSLRCLDVLDLSRCSADTSRHVSWTTDVDTRGSEHFPVYITHDRLSPSSAAGIVSLTNWSVFREGLRMSVYAGVSPKALLQAVRPSINNASVRSKRVTGHVGHSPTT